MLDRYLRRLRCPVLAMHGDRDEFGSSAHPKRIAELAPTRTDVVIFEDCGHVPHREKPDLVLRAQWVALSKRASRDETLRAASGLAGGHGEMCPRS